MADSAANALSTTSDMPTANTGTRTGTRAHRHHQPFKGQYFDLWKVAITSDRLKPAVYNKVRKQTSAVMSHLCTGNVTHVLAALSTGNTYQFAKPALTSIEKTAKITFIVEYDAYSKHKSAYDNNKAILTSSLLNQCDDSVLQQLAEMKDHYKSQYDNFWVLAALDQLCSSIYNDKIPLLQVTTTLSKLSLFKQPEHQHATDFREEFELNASDMKAVGATITLPAACLKLEENLEHTTTTLTDNVQQERAFERLMALVFLNQCGPSAEQTRTLLKTHYVQRHDHYPSNVTVTANLIRAAKKESRPCRSNRLAITLAQRAANSSATRRPSAEYPCDLCGAHDHWQPECPNNVRNGGASQPVATVSVEHIVSLAQNNSITLSDSLILLDFCSMCSVLKSPHLLCNVAH